MSSANTLEDKITKNGGIPQNGTTKNKKKNGKISAPNG
jgi:hypothetical protein